MSSIPVRLLAAALPVALALLILDVQARRVLPESPLRSHGAPAFVLLVAWCAGLAAAIAVASSALGILAHRLPRLGSRGTPIALALGGMLFAATLLDTARWTFTGPQARGDALGTWGPIVALGAAAVAGGLLAALARSAELRSRRRHPLAAWVVGGLFGLSAFALAWVDRTVYVGLYDRIHRALEFVATILALGAITLMLGPVTRGSAVRRAFVWCAASLSLAFLVAMTLAPIARRGIERDLRHVGGDRALVGRTIARMKELEAFFRGDAGELGLAKARIDELLERYDVPSATRDPRWDEPFREPKGVAEVAARFRDEERRPSIVVFYVDTLRADVAFDPDVMPNLAEFARSGLKFERAYTAGSDTLSALPAILGGHYDLRRVDDPDPEEETPADAPTRAPPPKTSRGRPTILEVARAQGVPTTLFIGESAWEFLDKLLPSFRFDEVERVRDYEKAGVWGYGAEEATSDAIVTRALDQMHARKEAGPFFSWLFQFDVHNWRELDARFIASTAQRFGMEDDGTRAFRYRVAARSVDASFGRLLDGLRALELEDEVVVLFLSDHGEALGRNDFWVHSIFLWESLVHVPLVLRAPGLPAGVVVTDQVGVVDVAPTLARYLHPAPSMVGYHGEDLVTYATPGRPPRRLPLLMTSVNERQLSRVAMIDGKYKLILRTDWGDPQLYDLAAPDPDDAEVAARQPKETTERMGVLLRSPVFINAYDDAKALEAADRTK